MRKGVPQPSMSRSWMLKSSRDGPSLLSNLAMSPSVLSVLHHASNVRTADMSIIVCGPRSQRTNISQSAYKYSRRHGGRFCNSTALTSSSTARILSPKSSPRKHIYGETLQRGAEKSGKMLEFGDFEVSNLHVNQTWESKQCTECGPGIRSEACKSDSVEDQFS